MNKKSFHVLSHFSEAMSTCVTEMHAFQQNLIKSDVDRTDCEFQDINYAFLLIS